MWGAGNDPFGKTSNKYGTVDTDRFEFQSKNCCWRAQEGWCKFRHRRDGRLLSLEEAGRGAKVPEGKGYGARRDSGGSAGGGRGANTKPKIAKDDEEDGEKAQRGDAGDEKINKLKENLIGRMDTGNLEDIGGVNIDLLEEPALGEALTQRHATTEKNVCRAIAASKNLHIELEKLMWRAHEDAPLMAGGTLGIKNAKLLLEATSDKLDAMGVGEVPVEKHGGYTKKMAKTNAPDETKSIAGELLNMCKEEFSELRKSMGTGASGSTSNSHSQVSVAASPFREQRDKKKSPGKGAAAAFGGGGTGGLFSGNPFVFGGPGNPFGSGAATVPSTPRGLLGGGGAVAAAGASAAGLLFGGGNNEDESESEEFHSGDEDDDDDDDDGLEAEEWFKPLKDMLEEVFTKRFAEVKAARKPEMLNNSPYDENNPLGEAPVEYGELIGNAGKDPLKLGQQIGTPGEELINQVRLGLKEGEVDMNKFTAQNFVKGDFEVAANHVVNPVVDLFKKYQKSAEVLVAIASTHALFFSGRRGRGCCL